jgi:formate hydrogenlyase subunit 6/NADH:ubiquinone oxidoreductase subunit I
MLPGFINSAAKLVFVKTPRFHAEKCIRCGRCAEICPPHILRFSAYADGIDQATIDAAPNKNAAKDAHIYMLDRKKCLHCFCCHEICPVEAITLHRF